MSDDPLTAITAALARLEAGQTTLRTDLMARMDRLQNSLTAIRDDISVNMGATDAAQRANDNTRELVRLQGEQMSAMWRKIQRLEDKVRGLTGEP